MDADGANKTQLTNHTAREELSAPLQNIWSENCQSFYFQSLRSGNGDIYRMNADGTGLIQITYSDSTDRMPNLSPDGTRLAYLSKHTGADNIWVLDLNSVIMEIPDTTVQNVRSVDVPIRLVNMSNQEIYSFEFVINTDSDVLVPRKVITENKLTDEWGPATPNIQDGSVKLAMAGIEPITGSGVLAYIRYDISDAVICSGSSAIQITELMFNENMPANISFDGSLAVSFTFDVSGKITYYSTGFGVEDASLALNSYTEMTDNLGDFRFEAVPCGDYSLIPSLAEPADDAINPYDAALILRAKNDFITLTPYQHIAADVTGNGEVTAFDASYILRYFVGNVSDFPVGEHWRFVTADFLIDETNWMSAPDSIQYSPLGAVQVDQNFIGIVYGDVSGSWGLESEKLLFAAAENSVKPRIVFDTVRKESNTMYALPFRLETQSEIFSLGITCRFEYPGCKFIGLQTTGENAPMSACNVRDGAIHFALASAMPFNRETKVIELKFSSNSGAPSAKDCPVLVENLFVNGKRITPEISVVSILPEKEVPARFALLQNYPNPFNSSTIIRCEIAEPGPVSVSIFNVLGQRIKTLCDEEKSPGSFQVEWDGRNDAGDLVGTGEYLCRMQAGEFIAVRKIVVMR